MPETQGTWVLPVWPCPESWTRHNATMTSPTFLAAGHDTGWWDKHGRPAPWPEDYSLPDGPSTPTGKPAAPPNGGNSTRHRVRESQLLTPNDPRICQESHFYMGDLGLDVRWRSLVTGVGQLRDYGDRRANSFRPLPRVVCAGRNRPIWPLFGSGC